MDAYLYLKAVLALLLVLGIISTLAVVSHYIMKRKLLCSGRSLAKNNVLDVVESRYIDNKRRIVLIRNKSNIYMFLLGPEREVFVDKFPVDLE
ncbi:flagellar protein FliO/FliZ [Alphaproteobacteria bacterium]